MAPSDTHTQQQRLRLARIHVLVVISSQKAAELIRSLFQQLGFRSIFIANDAIEAVQLLREIDIHLIVTDADLKIGKEADIEKQKLTLPEFDSELDGVHFVHRLRNAPNSPSPFIPVLMLMDRARHPEILLARDAGVNDVVLKPMEARDFCDRVIQLIDKPRAFITAPSYRGPCRRRAGGPPPGTKERRVRDVRIIRCGDAKGGCT